LSIILINMIGTVYKIHSDFYYVMPDGENLQKALVECKLREILKKQKTKIVVGDFVETSDGAITKVLKRKNFCTKPSVSNLDLMLVVSAILEPELNFIQLNRYLTFLKYHNIPALLCFNKDDLTDKDELEKIKSRILNIYKPLGYDIVFTSALKCDGLVELKKYIKGKTIALTGLSGVGKSSLLNALNPKFNLRTKNVSDKLKRGVHTTRHCEILEFPDFKIIDTPGFSRLTFDFILPKDLGDYFEEIKALKNDCKYTDCLHLIENGEDCNVIKNLDNKLSKVGDDIYLIGNSPMTYELNKTFASEFNFISFITALFIFLVIGLTFKSIVVQLLLTLIIQCAVYITMGILSLLGGEVYFISLIIVQSILMGATIDYAILYTNYYIEYRKRYNKKGALIYAYNESIHTILTSSLILIIVTFIVCIFADQIASKICITISQGTLCATLLVLFILPPVLAALDKFFVKKP